MILLTGYRGFIGSRLAAKLTDWVGIDLKDGMNLLTCELPKDIDLIYHLAAQSDVEPSWKDPLNDLENIRMTARLSWAYPHAKIIYANSCASMNPETPYGFSKGAAEDFLFHFHKGEVVSLIFPNIYGPGSRSVVDKFKGQKLVTVYGTGLQTRDYVHVDDIVEGLLKAPQWPQGQHFMGSGTSRTVLELAGDRAIQYEPGRMEAQAVNVPNTTPDWEPTISVMKYLAL